ncbi:ATP-binding protein [Catellatospora sp. NPDC049609]|uniref:ATP-binding protein n=1 Tax=Catellatospora sp. NPDC049609 TaxID=3155505 RepID=UPI003430B792
MAHELVSNAVRHGGGCTGVLLRLTGDEIIMEVTDRSPAAPGPRDGGYGLLIIGELAEAWGVEPVDEGKRIWVRMARPQVATRSGVHEAGVCRVR